MRTTADMALTPILLGACVGTLLVLLITAAQAAHIIKTDPNCHPWPSITRCRICNERVFAWQRKERREFTVKMHNPDGVAVVGTGASGIVHKACKGNPEFEFSVKVVQ